VTSHCTPKGTIMYFIFWDSHVIAQLMESREVQKALTTRITVAKVSILQHKIEQPVQYQDRISVWLQYHLIVLRIQKWFGPWVSKRLLLNNILSCLWKTAWSDSFVYWWCKPVWAGAAESDFTAHCSALKKSAMNTIPHSLQWKFLTV